MEDQVGFLMRVAMQRHTSIFTALMVHGLTQTQFAALAKLVEVGTCSQNHLGRLIHLDAATIKGVVDRLRMRKLVTVQFNPKDRRRSMVAATRNGHRVANEAIRHGSSHHEKDAGATEAAGAAPDRPAPSKNALTPPLLTTRRTRGR